jgi:hypothetical protein
MSEEIKAFQKKMFFTHLANPYQAGPNPGQPRHFPIVSGWRVA